MVEDIYHIFIWTDQHRGVSDEDSVIYNFLTPPFSSSPPLHTPTVLGIP